MKGPSLCAEKPCVPKNMIGTLTLSILKFLHTLISIIMFNKLCSVASPRHPKPLPLENHVRIIALTPDLQRVSFYSVTEFLHHSSTTEFILSFILFKGSYPSSKTLINHLFGTLRGPRWKGQPESRYCKKHQLIKESQLTRRHYQTRGIIVVLGFACNPRTYFSLAF
jgi:hypothetical protein